MDVVKVTRGRQALVSSRGDAKPATSPTFNLLGHRKALDGLTWDQHYKKALEKLAQEHQPDQQLRPLLERLINNPAYAKSGLTVDQLMQDKPTLSRFLADASTRLQMPQLGQIAASIDPASMPGLPTAANNQLGNEQVRIPSAWATPANTLAAAVTPLQTAGFVKNVARFIPDFPMMWFSKAPLEQRNEIVRQLVPLMMLQEQRNRLPVDSPEGKQLDQQIEATKATIKPFSGTNATLGDEAKTVGSGFTGELASTAFLKNFGLGSPLIGAATNPGQFFDPKTRDASLGRLGGQIAALKAVNGNVAPTTLLPRLADAWKAKQVGRLLPSWASRVPGLGRLAGIPAAAAAGDVAATGLATRLAGGLGRTVAKTPAAALITSGAVEAATLPHHLSDEGQAEMVQQMIEQDRKHQTRGDVSNAAHDTWDIMTGPFKGFDEARANTALLASEATGTVPDEVLQDRHDIQAAKQHEQYRNQLQGSYERLLPNITPTQAYYLAEHAALRRGMAERNEAQINPVDDERRMDQVLTQAKERGLLTRELSGSEIMRMQDVARSAGAEAATALFFPPTYTADGQEGPEAANPRAFEALARSASEQVLPAKDFDYLHGKEYYRSEPTEPETNLVQKTLPEAVPPKPVAAKPVTPAVDQPQIPQIKPPDLSKLAPPAAPAVAPAPVAAAPVVQPISLPPVVPLAVPPPVTAPVVPAGV